MYYKLKITFFVVDRASVMYWFGVVYAERRESPEEYIETFPNGKI
jgi:hypothetical protein